MLQRGGLISDFSGLAWPHALRLHTVNGSNITCMDLRTDYGNVLYSAIVWAYAADMAASQGTTNVEKLGDWIEAALG